MRTIKFRAWNKRSNKYLYPYPEGFYVLGEVTAFDLIGQQLHDETPEIPVLERIFLDIGLEQFTGLVDKNGKEIYEGDIVRDYIGNCIYVFKFGTISHTVKSKLTDQLIDVTFTGFYVDIPKIGTELLLWSSVKESEIEVIGNVHETPELL